MTEHFNELTPAEDERLTVLIEEMAEAIQVACKIQRHGYDSYHPTNPRGPNNRALLVKELGDVRYALELLQASADVNRLAVMDQARRKATSVLPYLHHQPVELLGRVQGMFEP